MAGVKVEKRPPIMTVILSRPEVRNAVDADTARELAEAFRMFDQDTDAHVGVFHGDHGTFCSGADLRAIADGRTNRMEPTGDGPMGPSRMVLSKPVIAAVSGYAVAGGLELALWCDLRIVEEDAVMGVFCRRWGVPLVDGGTVRLPRLIGLSRALDLIITGRAVNAPEALAIGLATQLVAPGTARAKAEELAAVLATLPQECLRNDRLSAYEQFDLTFDEAIANEFRHGLKSISPETVQKVRKFVKGSGRHGAPT